MKLEQKNTSGEADLTCEGREDPSEREFGPLTPTMSSRKTKEGMTKNQEKRGTCWQLLFEPCVVLKRPKAWKHRLRTYLRAAPKADPSSGLGGEEKKREKKLDDVVVILTSPSKASKQKFEKYAKGGYFDPAQSRRRERQGH